MKDQAARIDRATWAERAARENWTTERIAKYHTRAITAAVRKERERCVGIVSESKGSGTMGERERQYMCEAIIEKINAPAKKRKGKR